MNNIEEKVYEYSKKIVLKDGTIKEYTFKKAYKPADKLNKITQKKILDKVREIKKDKYEAFYKYISEFIEQQNE